MRKCALATESDLEGLAEAPAVTESIGVPTVGKVLTPRTVGGLKVGPVEGIEPFFNIMIYGNPGTGKTVLAGSASTVEAMSPVLFIDVEGGTLSLRKDYPNCEVVRVQSWRDMQKVYDELHKGMDYKTVVLDSLTEIQKFSMGQIMKDLTAREPDRDPDVPGLREWGKNTEQIRLLVRAFRDLPINTIFTALAMHEKDGKTGLTVTRPALSGKLSFEAAGFVDIVTYMYVKVRKEEIKRLLLSAMTDTTIAKDRSASLPSVLESPTMEEIHQLINQNRS